MKTSFRINSKRFIPVLMAIILAFTIPFAEAQKKKKAKPKAKKEDKSTLQTKKQNLQSEIDLTNKLLAETRRNKTLSLSQLVTLNKKIEMRQELIATINEEIAVLNKEIILKQNEITMLDSQVAKLKREYAHMIVFAYRNRNAFNNMMFLFAASDFNQAYMRMKYLQLISTGRRLQALKIAAVQQEVNEQLTILEQDKAQKKGLLGNEQEEQGNLAVEKDEKDAAFRGLQTKEANLKADLAKKNAQKVATDLAIQKILDDEMARATAAAKPPTPKVDPKVDPKNPPVVKPKDKPTTNPTPTPITLTPEAKTLGADFATNQGKLPWPVEKGTITGRFGKHEHPVLKGVMMQNNGVDISTSSGSMARAVFAGEVTGLTNIPGAGWLVIVRHGEYLTVYANLEEVSVKQGDNVKLKQSIGKVSTDQSEGTTTLHFEVWKSGGVKMDPEAWLTK